MSGILNEVATVNPPISGRVIRLDVSTTGALFIIPAGWAGMQCTWTLYSDDLATTAIAADVLFGSASVSVTYDTDSTVNTGAITVNTASGARVYSQGGSRHWFMPTADVATHFYVDASGNGHLEILRG